MKKLLIFVIGIVAYILLFGNAYAQTTTTIAALVICINSTGCQFPENRMKYFSSITECETFVDMVNNTNRSKDVEYKCASKSIAVWTPTR